MRFATPRAARCLRSACAVFLAATAGCGGAAKLSPVVTMSPVRGRLEVLADPGAERHLAPVVMLLEPIGGSDQTARSARVVRVMSTTDLFDPAFAAASAGDTVVLVNGGTLHHRFFSTDLEADLGTEVIIPVGPKGEYASVDFVASGLKRLYCSLHPEETFSIFVSSTPYYAIADRDGSYLVPNVPDGRYRLAIWSAAVAGPIRNVRVDASRRRVENIWIDSKRLSR